MDYLPIQCLLDKIRVLDRKFRQSGPKDNFNIFTSLRSASDEAGLHSKFIYTLLSETGGHQLHREMLLAFLDVMVIGEFSLEGSQVFRERHRIDLLVQNKKQAIIIENKIWANDQPSQIQRYCEKIQKENRAIIRVIYLTPYGSKPTEQSVGESKHLPNWESIFILASYRHHIRNWISRCIELAAQKPALREALIQYHTLISDLTGENMNKEEIKEIVALLGQGDNLKTAHLVVQNWNHVRWHAEWNYWTSLEKELGDRFQIMAKNKFSSAHITDVVHGSGRKPWFGVMFSIFEHGEDNFCIYIEHGKHSLNVGLTVLVKEVRDQNHLKRFEAVFLEMKEISSWPEGNVAHPYWLGLIGLNPSVNFFSFNSDASLSLLNETGLKSVTHQHAAQITEFADAAKEKISRILSQTEN